MNQFRDLVMSLGFDSLKEFNLLIDEVELDTQDRVTAFRKWQKGDGTKKGLLELIERGN